MEKEKRNVCEKQNIEGIKKQTNIMQSYGYDILTGACNRAGFTFELERLRAEGLVLEKFAILFINVDGFKAINDLFSFDAGDVLLRDLYKLFELELKPRVGARKESDHFVFLVERKNLDLLRLRDILNFKWSYHEQDVFIRCLCGIYYIRSNESDVKNMMDRARLAHDYITEASIKPYAVYSRVMRNNYIERAEVLASYEDALENGQFKVYYQPVVDAQTGKVVSAEALVRWVRPEKGVIAPHSFVPIIEEYGNISKLDRFVIQTVNKFLHDRYDNGLPCVPISINLSRKDFLDKKLLDDILYLAKTNPWPVGSVRYEITESFYTSLEQHKSNFLRALHEYGRLIMLDDFGSGYSSFGSIQDFDFDIIKLDMSLIRKISVNPKVKSIVRKIIEMFHELGIKVVAEGVEKEDQYLFLKDEGCDMIQGYYFSKALPEERFDEYIKEKM